VFQLGIVIGHKTDRIEHRLDFWIRHEVPPTHPRSVVLDAHDNLRLIQAHIKFVVPSGGQIKAVVKTVDAPSLRSQIAVEMLECRHGFFGSVWHHTQRSGNANCPAIVAGLWLTSA
jgi:hypothetical protein